MNGSMEDWFRTVRVRKGCLLSPTFFNIFIKRIMFDALEEQDGKEDITNLRFANALAEEQQEQEIQVESLNKTCTGHKMEINAEKI